MYILINPRSFFTKYRALKIFSHIKSKVTKLSDRQSSFLVILINQTEYGKGRYSTYSIIQVILRFIPFNSNKKESA